MKKDEVCELIRKIGIIPAIRVSSGDDAHFAAEAVTKGGIPIVEITMTVPGATELITHLVHYHPKMVVERAPFAVPRQRASVSMLARVS